MSMKESITLRDVFAIPDREAGANGKERWAKIGVAFVNRDNSINIILDAFPVNGRLQLRERKPFQKSNPVPQAA